MSFHECIKAYPEGSSSLSRYAWVAKRLGYSGLIVCNVDPEGIFRPEAAESIRGIDLEIGAEVTAATPRSLRDRTSRLRRRYPFLMVRATREDQIRAACEDPNIDMLLLTCDGHRPLDIASARSAASSRVAIGFDLGPMIRLRGRARVRWLESVVHALTLARKLDLELAITAAPRSHLDLRAPRDLLALAEVAGFEPDEAKRALICPGRLLEQNRRKWAGPGVEVL
ncbi:MAG: RNase P subunit p30 family protein [Methanothrix sp.]|nr:RNase P subunit p30 family protein [Methanothrix sp.]